MKKSLYFHNENTTSSKLQSEAAIQHTHKMECQLIHLLGEKCNTRFLMMDFT